MTKKRHLALLALLAISLPGAARAQLAQGDPVAPLLAAAPSGSSLPPTAGRVLLLDFWASWCAPCKASFPAYGRLFAEFAPKGLVVVAVSVDQRLADYEGFIRRYAPPFPVLLDRDQRLVRMAQVPAMPTCYLVGRDGRVRAVLQGFHGADSEQSLRRLIQSLLSEPAP